ncbi:MAG: LysM peptidoglycan-binding domain-containing protein, partial [Acidobacteriota bacterium]|nr:LysM peptidoglycan-binding domain-containing protein [Acidobacteriota bacterium]
MLDSPAALLVRSHTSRLRVLGAPCALALLALLLAGCATTPPPAQRPEPGLSATAAPVVVEEPTPVAVEPPGRDASLSEAAELVVLARDQAWLGMYEDAEASWNEAIELLWPYVGDDPEMINKLRAIETERDQALMEAESRGEEVGSPGGEDADVAIVEQIIEGPEPELDPRHVASVEEASQDVEPDYPVIVNDRVLAWLEAYSGRLSGWFGQSLARSGEHIDRFREIFAEEGVPQDLVYLAHVESGFKTRAYSRAHAKGIFQFISGTGRRYGLVTNWWIDERSDPEKSCRAAASYLRDLYEEFGDWYLALAGYNAGEGRVRRAIRSSRSRDFWVHSKKRLLRRETRNYVPAILAATLIAKEPEKFGFHDLVYESPIPHETVYIPTPTDLTVISRITGVDVATLERLNPALRRGQTPPKYPDYPLHVPEGVAQGFAEKLAQVPENEKIVKVLHRVQRGDTLSVIARRNGTSVRAIQLQNNMGRRTLLRIGQVLEIPRGPVSTARSSSRSSRARASTATGDWHRVRRGDTLGSIARRYRVSVTSLQDWNRLGRSTKIIAGQRLRVRSRGGSGGGSGEVGSSLRASTGGEQGVHVVRSGDSLWKIARTHGVSLDSLMRANGLSKRSVLKPGQRLAIPGAASTASAKAAAPAG